MAIASQAAGSSCGIQTSRWWPADFRHHLHGDDRQPAIRLDAFRRSDRQQIPLGSSGDSGRLHDFRVDGNVAGADRGLSWIDKFGPRIMVGGSGVLVAIAWAMNSVATSLFHALCRRRRSGHRRRRHLRQRPVGNALEVVLPDRRGLAAGLTAAGFGAGAAITVVPIRAIIDGPGYETAFLWFGLGQGLIILIVSQFLKAPQPGQIAAPSTVSGTAEQPPIRSA